MSAPTAPRLVAAVWHLFRRERPLLLAIAGLLVFLPAWAVLLLCDPLPALPPSTRDPVAMGAWIDAVTAWGQANAVWYVLADAVAIFGTAAMALLLLDARRPTAGEALRRAAVRYWPFLGATMLVSLPVGAGMWLFVIPGLWAQARLIAAVPVLAHDPGAGVVEALRRSSSATRGRGLVLTAAVAILFMAQWLAVVPLASADDWLRAPGHGNPAILALVDAGIAAAGAAYHVALLLLGVIAYRMGASRGT